MNQWVYSCIYTYGNVRLIMALPPEWLTLTQFGSVHEKLEICTTSKRKSVWDQAWYFSRKWFHDHHKLGNEWRSSGSMTKRVPPKIFSIWVVFFTLGGKVQSWVVQAQSGPLMLGRAMPLKHRNLGGWGYGDVHIQLFWKFSNWILTHMRGLRSLTFYTEIRAGSI